MVMSVGTLMNLGTAHDFMVMLNSHLSELPERSTTVMATLVVPIENTEPG